MRKLAYGSLFLALVGIGMIGCKKEHVQQNEVQNTSNEFGVSTNGEMLVFSSTDGYMKAVDGEYDPNHERILQLVKNLKFDNYFTKNAVSESSGEHEMDDFFGQLLNGNGCVEIQKNIYRIDLQKEKVFVITKDKYTANSGDFLNGNLQNKDILEFNLNEDVLDIMNGGDREKASCLNPGTITSTSYTQGGMTPIISNVVKLGAFGIYFRVTGRSQVLSTYSGPFTMEFILTGNATQIHRRPCSNNDVTWHTIGTKAAWGNPGNNEQVWEAYSKSWNVKEMYMRGRTKCVFGSPLDDGNLIRETNDALVYF